MRKWSEYILQKICRTKVVIVRSALAIPNLLEKYNKAFDERREKIRAFKSGLIVNSSTDDIDCYNQMCFDACQDLQDLSKLLKEKGKKKQ